MSFESVDPGEGHSIAAWTAVVVMLVAITIGTVAFFLDLPGLVWAAVVLLLVGPIAGFVLSRLGYGVADVTPHESH